MARQIANVESISMSDALVSMLGQEAQDYINEKGAEVGTLSAMEQKLEQKAKKLREKLNDTPEAQQLKKVKDKLKAVKAKRTEQVTKISGVIEKELGKNAEQAIEAMFGDAPKALNGR